MNENLSWAWLVVGLAPYQIERQRPSRYARRVTIRALFWTLEVRTRRVRRQRLTDWTLRIPLIERVRDAVWAAVTRLRERDSGSSES